MYARAKFTLFSQYSLSPPKRTIIRLIKELVRGKNLFKFSKRITC